MPDSPPSIYFQSEAGLLLQHAAGYAELRYLPVKRSPTALATLLTRLGQLLLERGWTKFLADNRQMTPLTVAEKEWFVSQWLGQRVPRPAPLLGVVVMPHDVFARLSFLEMYAQASATSIKYRTYTDLTEAQAYIAHVKFS